MTEIRFRICILLIAMTGYPVPESAAAQDVTSRDQNGNMPLHNAACYGTVEDVLTLLAKGADVNAKGWIQRAPLHLAAACGTTEIAELLIGKGGTVDARDEYGGSPLHQASSDGKKEVAVLLLRKGAAVNAKNLEGWTPLHSAASRGRIELANLLVASGANVNATDDKGKTPHTLAVVSGSKEVADLLVAKGTDITLKDKDGGNLLHSAARSRSSDVALALISAQGKLSKGLDVNAKNNAGETPLHIAANSGTKEFVAWILGKGADVKSTNMSSATPLHVAASHGTKEVVELLIASGADANAKDMNENTPLKRAVYRRDKDLVELLLASGADANSADRNGTTALNMAEPMAEIPEIKALLANRISPRQQVLQLAVDLQRSPENHALRERIIRLARTLDPKPAIPAQTLTDLGVAEQAFKKAKSPKEFAAAIAYFEFASRFAPWDPGIYFNLGLAQEQGKRYDDAIRSFQYYLMASPNASDAAAVQKRLGGLRFLAGQNAQELAERTAKYGSPLAPGTSFNQEHMFRYGAVTKDVNFDARGSVIRRLSLKVQTRKQNGRLVNYLGIFDFTSPADIFGQTFDLGWRGTKSYYLDDVNNQGYLTLTVASSVAGDAAITLAPASNASDAMQTTIADLLRERARQAVFAGSVRKLGDTEFYVIPQGGEVAALLYFASSLKDRVETANPSELMPSYVANVSRLVNGKNQPFPTSDVGIVKGVPYFLEWDGIQFIPKVGRGRDN